VIKVFFGTRKENEPEKEAWMAIGEWVELKGNLDTLTETHLK
jgi:putative heme degradation protein